MQITKLLASFSGALVLLAMPFDADSRELPASVLKYDLEGEVDKEVALTRQHGKDWGATFPQIHQAIGKGSKREASIGPRSDGCTARTSLPTGASDLPSGTGNFR